MSATAAEHLRSRRSTHLGLGLRSLRFLLLSHSQHKKKLSRRASTCVKLPQFPGLQFIWKAPPSTRCPSSSWAHSRCRGATESDAGHPAWSRQMCRSKQLPRDRSQEKPWCSICAAAASRQSAGGASVCSGCTRAAKLTPRSVANRIGTEHEKFGFRKADKRPMDYEDIKHLLNGLVGRCDCSAVLARRWRIWLDIRKACLTFLAAGSGGAQSWRATSSLVANWMDKA